MSKIGLVAVDYNLRERISSKGDCLGALYKPSSENNLPSFVFTALDCTEHKTAVCEKQVTKFHATKSENPHFPCIPQKLEKKRKKRSNGQAARGANSSRTYGKLQCLNIKQDVILLFVSYLLIMN